MCIVKTTTEIYSTKRSKLNVNILKRPYMQKESLLLLFFLDKFVDLFYWHSIRRVTQYQYPVSYTVSI